MRAPAEMLTGRRVSDRHDRVYRVVGQLLAIFHAVLGIRFDIRGADHIPASGPAVIAANHIGFLDFTFVGKVARARGRHVRFMTKRRVFELAIVGRLMQAMRHIPVDRRSGAMAYRQALRLIDAGEIVGVFPEATISRSWLLKPFKRGAAGLAVARQVRVIPVIVWGGHRIYTVDGHRSLRRHRPVSILLGEPLMPNPGESIDALSARLYAVMKALLDEAIGRYPQQPRNAADRWWLPASKGGTAPDPATAARLDRDALARIGESIDD